MKFTVQSPAIDMPRVNPVGKMASAYLMRCGYSQEEIDSWTGETRLLQDIGLCGDDIVDEFNILHTEFGVDLSEFNFGKSFPAELSMDALLISARSLLRALGLRKLVEAAFEKYPEVTLEMIEAAIGDRKWKARF